MPDEPAAAATPAAEPAMPAPVRIKMVYRYSEGKNSHWTLVTDDDVAAGKLPAKPRTMSYSAKAGRGKIVGAVYVVDSVDDAGTTIYPSTATFDRQWPVAEDRAAWKAHQTAVNLEKQAKDADAIVEALEPLLQRYRRLGSFGARAAMLHQVIKAFEKA